MSESSRVVERLTVEGIRPLGAPKPGVAEYYFSWDDFVSGHGPTPSAALFIADSINSVESQTRIENAINKFICIGHQDNPAEETQKSSVWLHIRITPPNGSFKEARWHQDGPYMQFDTGHEHDLRYKYCLTILGPGTIFLEQSPEEAGYTATASRSQIAQQLSTCKTYQSTTGEVVRCTWKRTVDDISSDVHTEPPHDEDRIFLAGVFMSDTELDNLTANRK